MSGPIYVILFGLIFFGIGGGLTYRQYTFEQQAIPVQGKVTGVLNPKISTTRKCVKSPQKQIR